MRKKILYIGLGLLGFLLLAMVLIPVLFKDQIREGIDGAIDEQINAQVFYNADGFSLSLFRDFPNLSVRMTEFGVVGDPPFETDTLVSVERFDLSINLWSLFGDPEIHSIQLVKPKIFVLVLEDGLANYDIAKESVADSSSVEEESEPTEASDLTIAIRSWEIIEGELIYYDHSMPFYVRLLDLNHEGSGNFGLSEFDMQTLTSIGRLDLGYDGTEYLSNKRVEADVTLA